MFIASDYVNTIDTRLKYINDMEHELITNYGINYIEYIETIYYENDINEPINNIYIGISLDELIKVVLCMDMFITEDSIKYINGIIYDIGGIEIWNTFKLLDKIKIYQLLSVIKKTYGINELNQIHNISKSLALTLFDKKYDHVCYLTYDKKITGIAILLDDTLCGNMLRHDLNINNNNIKYLQQILLIDNDYQIIKLINNDMCIIGIYIGDLEDKQIIYWRWKNYKHFNEYFMVKIYDKIVEVDYNNIIEPINIDNNTFNNSIIRDKKIDTKRKRLYQKRKRYI
jgi:hypothetical protein